MSTFEVLIVVLNASLLFVNLIIAVIYAAILWMMVQQRRLMDQQLSAMQAQLREAERTRIASHRPVLRVEPPIVVPAAVPAPPIEMCRFRNIGVGVALEVAYFIHDRGTGVVWLSGGLDPIGAGDIRLSHPFPNKCSLLMLL